MDTTPDNYDDIEYDFEYNCESVNSVKFVEHVIRRTALYVNLAPCNRSTLRQTIMMGGWNRTVNWVPGEKILLQERRDAMRPGEGK